jgi:hypothetical protein
MKKMRERDWGRGAANTMTILVGAAAGYLSWRHLNHLGLTKGLDVISAALTAAPIDGMIVVGTLQLRAARKAGRPAHWSAYLCVIVGVAATIGGNIAAAPANLWARILFAIPPLAFLLSIEALFGKPLTRNLWELIRDIWHRDRPVQRPAMVLQYARPIGPMPAPVVPVQVEPVTPVVRKRPPSSADKVVKAHRKTPEASHAELARQLKLSVPTVKRYRPQRINGEVPQLEQVAP